VVLSHASLHWSPLVLVFEEQSRKGGPPAHHLPSGILHLPAGSQQTPRPPSVEDSTGLLQENFFRPRPSPSPSCHKNEKQQRQSKIRTQKVVRSDNGSFPDEVNFIWLVVHKTKVCPQIKRIVYLGRRHLRVLKENDTHTYIYIYIYSQ
jgi:hypothetical protein